MNVNRMSAFALSIVLAATALSAQDDSLYPDPSSPTAAFLRIHAQSPVSLSIAGKDQSVGEAGMTAYAEVEAGDVRVGKGDSETTYQIDANTHYTVLADEEGMPLITDGVTDSPAQADLLLYNLSDMESFDLFAVEADTVALSDVAPAGHKSVGLQAPLTLTFTLRQNGETLGMLEPIELRRGTATTIVVSDGGKIDATTSTYAN